MVTRWLRAALMLTVATVVGLGAASPALAGPNLTSSSSAPSARPAVDDPGQGSAGDRSMCAMANREASDADLYASDYLPINRWGDSQPNYTRLQLSITGGAWSSWMQRTQIGTVMSVGNSLWMTGQSMVESATRFCVGEEIYATGDKVAARAGKAFMDSGIVSALVVIALISTLFRARKAGVPVGPVAARMIIALSVMASLIIGAHNSTSEISGKGSPGWWGQQVNDVINRLATAPSSALAGTATSISADTAEDDSPGGNILDCRSYEEALSRSYRDAFAKRGGGGSSGAVVPVSLDAMWRNSGLQTWQLVQFGDNEYAHRAGCRMLDYSSDTAIKRDGNYAGKAVLTRRVPVADSTNKFSYVDADVSAKSSAFVAPSDNAKMSQAMVAWAACQMDSDGTITADPDWTAVKKDITDDACKAFIQEERSLEPDMKWSAKVAGKEVAGGEKGNDKAFDLGDDDKEISKTFMKAAQGDGGVDEETAKEMEDYVLTMHGHRNTSAGAAAYVYVISSFVVFIAFGLIALAVFVAKAALVVMTALVVFMLMVSLVKVNSDPGHMASIGKKYVTYAFFAFATTLILSIVAIITALLQQIGSDILEQGSIALSVWTALSVAIALFIIHLFFKKTLKVASPFSPTGAMAWGATAAGGAVAGAGIQHAMARRGGDMARQGSRKMMKQAATTAGMHQLGDRIGQRKSGSAERAERTGGMRPENTRTFAGGKGEKPDQGFSIKDQLTGSSDEDFKDSFGVGSDGKINPDKADPDVVAAAMAEGRGQQSSKEKPTTFRGALARRRDQFGGGLRRVRGKASDVPGGGRGVLESMKHSAGAGLSGVGSAAGRGAAHVVNHPMKTGAKVVGATALAMSIPVAGPVAFGAVGAAWAMKHANNVRRERKALNTPEMREQRGALRSYMSNLESTRERAKRANTGLDEAPSVEVTAGTTAAQQAAEATTGQPQTVPSDTPGHQSVPPPVHEANTGLDEAPSPARTGQTWPVESTSQAKPTGEGPQRVNPEPAGPVNKGQARPTPQSPEVQVQPDKGSPSPAPQRNAPQRPPAAPEVRATAAPDAVPVPKVAQLREATRLASSSPALSGPLRPATGPASGLNSSGPPSSRLNSG